VRVGHGLDAHRLVAGRELMLGGVRIPHDRGLAGHSDGDALLHAVASAILGALGDGDLGTHFPSSDPALEGISSRRILARVMARARSRGLELGNLDATLIAQEPRLGPHLEAMRDAISRCLEVEASRVNVKVTSTDGLGSLGRGEGIAAQAVVLLESA